MASHVYRFVVSVNHHYVFVSTRRCCWAKASQLVLEQNGEGQTIGSSLIRIYCFITKVFNYSSLHVWPGQLNKPS